MGRLGQSRRRGSGGMKKGAGKIEHDRITQDNTEKTTSHQERGQRGGDRGED